MALRHYDALLARGLTEDLSDGITFGSDDDFSITQTQAESGHDPSDALVQAQSAPSGQVVPGGELTMSGGAPGAEGATNGDVVAELGPAVSDTTAALDLRSAGTSILRALLHIGSAAIRAAYPLALRLYSPVEVILEAESRAVRLTSAGVLTVQFAQRVVINSGQVQMVPAGVSPASGTLDLDFDVYAKRVYTLNGNATFAAPSNVLPGATYTIKVKQDLVGNRTATWNAAYKFGALNGTLSTAASAIDVFVFEGSDDGTLHCLIAAKGVHA